VRGKCGSVEFRRVEQGDSVLFSSSTSQIDGRLQEGEEDDSLYPLGLLSARNTLLSCTSFPSSDEPFDNDSRRAENLKRRCKTVSSTLCFR
jgi:hypothetical protein